MDDLAQFLHARLDEDAGAANLMAEFYPAPWDTADRGWMAHVVADAPSFREVTRLEQWAGMPTSAGSPDIGEIIAHIARHAPVRVLAEVDAKRRILDTVVPRMNEMDDQIEGEWGTPGSPDEYESITLLRLLALPYADHPDYLPEWAPVQA